MFFENIPNILNQVKDDSRRSTKETISYIENSLSNLESKINNL